MEGKLILKQLKVTVPAKLIVKELKTQPMHQFSDAEYFLLSQILKVKSHRAILEKICEYTKIENGVTCGGIMQTEAAYILGKKGNVVRSQFQKTCYFGRIDKFEKPVLLPFFETLRVGNTVWYRIATVPMLNRIEAELEKQTEIVKKRKKKPTQL